MSKLESDMARFDKKLRSPERKTKGSWSFPVKRTVKKVVMVPAKIIAYPIRGVSSSNPPKYATTKYETHDEMYKRNQAEKRGNARNVVRARIAKRRGRGYHKVLKKAFHTIW